MNAEDEITELKKRIAELEQRLKSRQPEINMHKVKDWVGRNALQSAALYKAGDMFRTIARNMAVPEDMRGKAALGFQLCETALLEAGGMPIPEGRLEVLLKR